MDGLQLGELVVIGLITGVVGGMLGVGGSLVMIPALTEVLGPDQHLYQAAAMIVNFFVVVPAVVRHKRAGAIDSGTVRRIVPLACIAVAGGVLLSEMRLFSGSGEAYLRALFGSFLLAVSVVDLYRVLARRRRNGAVNHRPVLDEETVARPAPGVGLCAAVAIPTGLIAGLLGVGGGVLAVPLQRRFLHIPMRQAIATSATIIIATSVIGAALKNYAYYVDNDHSPRSFALALILIPTAMTGSWFGSKLTHELPLRWIKAAFFLLLSVAAVRITTGAVHDLRTLNSPAMTSTVSG